METTVVLNNFPKTTIFVTTFHISVKNDLKTIFGVAMVTKFKNLSWLYDFIAMEYTVVLNDFLKTTISFATFFISIKKGFYIIVVVAMVTNMTKDIKWHTLCHSVSSPLKGTLCHLYCLVVALSGIMSLSGPIIPLSMSILRKTPKSIYRV